MARGRAWLRLRVIASCQLAFQSHTRPLELASFVPSTAAHGTATAQSRAGARGTREAAPGLRRRTQSQNVRLRHDCCFPHAQVRVVDCSYPGLRDGQPVVGQ